MKNSIRIILSIFWLLLGTTLFVLGLMGRVDSSWSGMGGGFIAVGILQTLRHVKYAKDESYREKRDIADKDERVRFISGRAWAWTGYIVVIAGGIGTIVFKLLGRDELMQFTAFGVCIVMVIYWLCYLVLSRKY